MCTCVTRGPGLVQIDQYLRALYIKSKGVILQYLGCKQGQIHENPYLRLCAHSLHINQAGFISAKNLSRYERPKQLFFSNTAPVTRKYAIVLVSNCRPALNAVCFLLGNSPASELYMLLFRNTLSVPSSWVGRYEE